jgi:hypothetical protein
MTPERLVPPPRFNPRAGMRTFVRVIPGWPQAVWVLSCDHRVIVPTWSDGRTSRKPRSKRLICEECRESIWKKRWDPWYDQHSERWFAETAQTVAERRNEKP